MQTKFWKRHNKFHVLLHVLAWLGFISLPMLFMGNQYTGIPEILQQKEFWFFAFCFIIPYYLNTYFWTPYVIRKKKYLL